jgi:hypothetical protein
MGGTPFCAKKELGAGSEVYRLPSEIFEKPLIQPHLRDE